jgi:uncharacterized membrane protein
MALVGRLHPLLVHFPIALVITAALAEFVSLVTRRPRWHGVAVANLQVGAAFAAASAGAGWLLASSSIVEASAALEWHRWAGVLAAVAALTAASASAGGGGRLAHRLAYRVALGVAAVLVAAAGHLGAMLVWGAGFLRP